MEMSVLHIILSSLPKNCQIWWRFDEFLPKKVGNFFGPPRISVRFLSIFSPDIGLSKEGHRTAAALGRPMTTVLSVIWGGQPLEDRLLGQPGRRPGVALGDLGQQSGLSVCVVFVVVVVVARSFVIGLSACRLTSLQTDAFP